MTLDQQIQRTIAAIRTFPDREHCAAWYGMAYWQAYRTHLWTWADRYDFDSENSTRIAEMLDITSKDWDPQLDKEARDQAGEEFRRALFAQGYIDLAVYLAHPARPD